MVAILLILLLSMVNAQSYIERENLNPYEIFTAPLEDQLKHNWPSVPKILFITSWSPSGLIYAIRYAHKFETVVICWLDLELKADTFSLIHSQSFDLKFISKLRKANPKLKVLLRIYFASSSRQIYENIGSNSRKIAEIARIIQTGVRKAKVDGVFWESPYSLPYLNQKGPQGSKYDRLATVISVFIVNKIKDQLMDDQYVYYALCNPDKQMDAVDLGALLTIKADAFVVGALENDLYEQLALQALILIEKLKINNSKLDFYILLPFFSRRDEIGMPTPTVLKYLEKNGVEHKGFYKGVCFFVEGITHIRSYVPCLRYFNYMLQHCERHKLGLAFYEASQAIEKYFEFL